MTQFIFNLNLEHECCFGSGLVSLHERIWKWNLYKVVLVLPLVCLQILDRKGVQLSLQLCRSVPADTTTQRTRLSHLSVHSTV